MINKIVDKLEAVPCRFISAKCSNGEYLGYANTDEHPTDPLSEHIASNTTGFDHIDGTYGSLLEDFGLETENSSSSTFRDKCLDGSVVVGFQITLFSGIGVLQIRFLCSPAAASSVCGTMFFPFARFPYNRP